MPAPSVSFTTIPSTDLDQDSPVTTTLLTALYNNTLHLKEVLYGTGSYVGNIPHDHDGAEDAAISAAFSGNLIMNGAPDDDGDGDWTQNGGCSIESDKGFKFAASSAGYAWQILTTRADLSKVIFGTSGADFCVSLWIRGKTSAPTAGEFHFGLADGSTTTYLASCKGVIDDSQITTSWKRFYMMLSAKAGSSTPVNTDVRLLLKQHSTQLNQDVIVSGIDVHIGQTLSYWQPAILENQSTHDDWSKYGLTDCPIYDKAAAITNATAITGA